MAGLEPIDAQLRVALRSVSGLQQPAGPTARSILCRRIVPYLSVYTWNRVVPRVGAVFDLSGDGKTVIRASYGQYNLDQLGTFDLNFNPAALFTNTYTWSGPERDVRQDDVLACVASDAFLAGLKGVGSPNYLSTTAASPA